jgi:hypothetical protein
MKRTALSPSQIVLRIVVRVAFLVLSERGVFLICQSSSTGLARLLQKSKNKIGIELSRKENKRKNSLRNMGWLN